MVATGNEAGHPGERLRKVALRKGLTMEALRRQAKVHPRDMARIKRGEIDDVSPRVWARLLTALDEVPDLPLADEVLSA